MELDDQGSISAVYKENASWIREKHRVSVSPGHSKVCSKFIDPNCTGGKLSGIDNGNKAFLSKSGVVARSVSSCAVRSIVEPTGPADDRGGKSFGC